MPAAGLYVGLLLTLGGCIINNVFLELVTEGNVKTASGGTDDISLLFADPGAGLLLTTIQYSCVVLCLLPYAIGFGAWIPGLPVPLPYLQLPQVPLSEYVIHVMIFLPMSALNNLAFQFPKVDQTLNVVIRSSHIVTTLAIGALVFRKRYTLQQAVASFVVFAGAATFAISRTAGGDRGDVAAGDDGADGLGAVFAWASDLTPQDVLSSAWGQRGALCLVAASMLGSFLTHMQGETNKRFRGRPEQATFWTHALCLLPLLVWTLEDLKPQGEKVAAHMRNIATLGLQGHDEDHLGDSAALDATALDASLPVHSSLREQAIQKTARRLLQNHPDSYTLGGAVSPAVWAGDLWAVFGDVSGDDAPPASGQEDMEVGFNLAAWNNTSPARLGLESKVELWAGADAPTACQVGGTAAGVGCGAALPGWLQWYARGIDTAKNSDTGGLQRVGQWAGSLPLLGLFVLLNGLSQVMCILGVQTLVANADAMVISLVLTARKVLTMVLSVALFGHEMPPLQIAAAVVTFVGIFAYSQLPRTKPIMPVREGDARTKSRTRPAQIAQDLADAEVVPGVATEASASPSSKGSANGRDSSAADDESDASPAAASGGEDGAGGEASEQPMPDGLEAYDPEARQEELMGLKAVELKALCDERGVSRKGLTRKAQYVEAIMEAEDEDIPEEAAEGEDGAGSGVDEEEGNASQARPRRRGNRRRS